MTLTFSQGHPRSYNFEGLLTGYLLANFHNSAVNSVQVIANVKVCHGRTDGRTDGQTDDGGSLHRLTLFTHVSQKQATSKRNNHQPFLKKENGCSSCGIKRVMHTKRKTLPSVCSLGLIEFDLKCTIRTKSHQHNHQ